MALAALGGAFALVTAPNPPQEKAPAPPPPATAPALPTVIIDAGHGGKDDGARCGNIREKNLTLALALRLEKTLEARGFPTVMIRVTDVFVPLPQRADIANSVPEPALFVSIHFNQAGGGESAGIETFYADTKAPAPDDWMWIGLFSPPWGLEPVPGANLAGQVQEALLLKTGARDRGVRARHLYVTRHTRLPAILVEGGFITNKAEARLLEDGHYGDLLAAGIADGVEAWWRGQRVKELRPPLAVSVFSFRPQEH